MGGGMGERKGIAAPVAPTDGRTDGRTDCGFGSFGGQRGRRRAGVRWRAGGRMVGWLGGVGGGGGGIGQIDIDLPRGMSGEQRPLRA